MTILSIIFSLIKDALINRNKYRRDCLSLKKMLSAVSSGQISAIDGYFTHPDHFSIRATDELMRFGNNKYFIARMSPGLNRWEIHNCKVNK